MEKPKIFVSHISEESPLAAVLKTNLSSDFLGLVEVFVSSDLESIAAGSNWLVSLEQALREATVLIALCSHASINRPWVNFEVGAAWVKSIPIVPVCHTGLKPRDLPIPYSVLQAVEASSETGLKGLYTLIARTLGCNVPQRDFVKLIDQISDFEHEYLPRLNEAYGGDIEKRTAAKKRLYKALADQGFKWRNIERLAILSGLSDDEALEILVQDPNVALGKGRKSGKRIARLKVRDNDGSLGISEK